MFALYGEVPGTREEGRLRADLAEPDAAPRVLFRFSLGEAVYRAERTAAWSRPKKRGGGTTLEPGSASLFREGEPAPLATKPTTVSAKVAELLGMEADQFQRVVLLPQGDFKKLLVAPAREREELLQRLFGTQRYEHVERWLRDRKNDLTREADEVRQRQDEVLVGESAEALASRKEAAARDLAGASHEARTREAESEAAEAALRSATALAGRFDELERASAEVHRQAADAPALAADRERLERADRAERVRERLVAAAEAERSRGARVADEEEGRRALAEVTAAAGRAAIGLRSSEESAAAVPALAARKQLLEQALPLLARLAEAGREVETRRTAVATAGDASRSARAAHAAAVARASALEQRAGALRPVAVDEGVRAESAARLEAAARSAKDRDQLAAQVRRLGSEVSDLARQAPDARDAADGARAQAAALSAARDAGMAVALAAKLERGAPCPVCGSREHPAPARSALRVPDKEDVDAARTTESRLAGHATEVAARLQAAETQLAEAKARSAAAAASEPRPVVELERATAAAKAALTEARSAAKELAQAESSLAGARRDADDALGRAHAAEQAGTAATGELEKAASVLAELRRQVEAAGAGPEAHAELDRLGKRIEGLEAALAAARRTHEAAQAALSAARATLDARERERAAASARAEASAADAAAACTGAGFADVAACEAALLRPGERETLARAVEERTVAGQASVRLRDALEVELRGRARPDVAALRASREAALVASREARDRVVHLERDLADATGREARIAELAARHAALARRLEVLGRVAEVANGNNPHRMSLQRFVLAARLEEVAEAASARLLLMSKGRFRLRHDTAVADRREASGLGLVVEDAWTGVRDRPAGALSGGESFLASLALALGLSDVVLRRSGGLRLDALFVDEGFGSLDEETLDDAIRALEDLREQGRLVGVISHVPELRRRIPARIEVRRGPEGAVAVVHPA